jgi:hypothetical protein
LHDNGGFALAVRGGSGNVVEFHRLDPATVEMKFDADDLNPFYLVREGRKAVRHEFWDILHVRYYAGAPIAARCWRGLIASPNTDPTKQQRRQTLVIWRRCFIQYLVVSLDNSLYPSWDARCGRAPFLEVHDQIVPIDAVVARRNLRFAVVRHRHNFGSGVSLLIHYLKQAFADGGLVRAHFRASSQ